MKSLLKNHLDKSPMVVATTAMVNLLSDREREVFTLLGSGHDTRAIAERLRISVSSIETYRAKIKSKLEIANATQLVCVAANWVQLHALRTEDESDISPRSRPANNSVCSRSSSGIPFC